MRKKRYPVRIVYHSEIYIHKHFFLIFFSATGLIMNKIIPRYKRSLSKKKKMIIPILYNMRNLQ